MDIAIAAENDERPGQKSCFETQEVIETSRVKKRCLLFVD
jgi:hypothetical protein